MADFSIPLAGMSQASSDFDQAATRIARSSVPTASAASPADTVDLSQEMVALLQAKNDFEANTKTVRVFDDMNRSTLDMIG
jgi:flagellar basal body rod protein FlgG